MIIPILLVMLRLLIIMHSSKSWQSHRIQAAGSLQNALTEVARGLAVWEIWGHWQA